MRIGLCSIPCSMHYIHFYSKKKAPGSVFPKKLVPPGTLKNKARGTLTAGLLIVDADHASSALGNVTPPTRTLTSATFRPLVASTLAAIASWTRRATSGMTLP